MKLGIWETATALGTHSLITPGKRPKFGIYKQGSNILETTIWTFYKYLCQIEF